MTEGLLARLPPARCHAVERIGDPASSGVPDPLHPEEVRASATFGARRLRDFAAVRGCARGALSALGHDPVPLLPGPGGAPVWPKGVVGSMTHCAGFQGAVVAHERDLLSVGVDAEPAEGLRHGLPEHICSGEREPAAVRSLSARAPRVPWDKVLFSAKESVYKAWFPLTGRRLGFEQAEVVMRADSATGGVFRARLLGERVLLDRMCPTGFHGRWAVDRGLVVTAVPVPAP
ncbi:4'-phosphopantetheinyl transferase superfamily protein [Streptomyces sp. NPDC026672]|uniref:4'-phosphopantetheinyl transferase family protein n=1 Tax=unclassified Streptomyces TaxID=2593676 RepID=UPI0033EBA077